MSSHFEELLQKTKEQPEPQRLLMHITPVMCVDKLPEELSNFSDLVGEADSINKDWNIVLFAALSGSNGTPPSTTEVDPYLNKMTNDVASGGDLSRYVIIDREQNPIEIML